VNLLNYITHRISTADDGYYQICPFGEAPIDKTRTQVFDRPAAEAIVANAATKNEDLLVDHDHFSRDPDKPTTALGWLTQHKLQVRDDGLYGPIELTSQGEPAIAGKVFRFGSPEFERNTCVDMGNGKLRPTVLAGFSFTNRPNFRNFKPHTHRDENTMILADELKKTLKLEGDITEDAILQHVQSLATERDTARTELATAREAEADALILQHTNRLPTDPAVRTILKNTILANRDQGLALIASYPAPAVRQPLHDPANARQPNLLQADAAKTAAQKEKLAIIAHRLQSEFGRKPTQDEIFSVALIEHKQLFSE
jgi:phage I-like protein